MNVWSLRETRIASGFVTYPGLKAVARQRGLTLRPLAMDEHGIIPQSFEECCAKAPPKALYVIPAIDNPTTATLPEERRHEIVSIARRYGVALIEERSLFRFAKRSADAARSPCSGNHLAHRDAVEVWRRRRCASLTSSLRVCSSGDAARGRHQSRQPDGAPDQCRLGVRAGSRQARWTTSRLRSAMRNVARQKLARSVLGECTDRGGPLAVFISGCACRRDWRAADFVDHAGRSGISVVPGSAFAIGPAEPEALRLSLGVAPDREALVESFEASRKPHLSALGRREGDRVAAANWKTRRWKKRHRQGRRGSGSARSLRYSGDACKA